MKGKFILQISVRGRLFKNERFLSSDSACTLCNLLHFYVKAQYRARKKMELRNLRIQLPKRTNVWKTTSWPAEKSGYCNHLKAWLYKLPSILLTDLMGYPRRKPAQVFLENGESLGSRDPKKVFYLILLKKVLYLNFK